MLDCDWSSDVCSSDLWRKAMNLRPARNWAGGRVPAGPATAPRRDDATTADATDGSPTGWALIADWLSLIKPRHVLTLAALLLYPMIATPFFTYQIGAQSLTLGLIALSLTFLAGYGGMLSLAQMTIAGITGYAIAIFGTSGTAAISLGWPWWLAVALAIALATIVGTLIGWLAVRTDGIYTIMITLAIGVAFFYLVQQNYAVFNGFQGFQQVLPPVFLDINWRNPIPFYYLSLFWAIAGYLFVTYLVRTPFGIALQGTRDNARRMAALGYDVTLTRIAAHAIAAFLAAIGGVLLVWYNTLITPGSVGTTAMINVLIVAVLGGLRHPIGPFIGAIVFVLLQNFAIDLVDRERFNLIIGIVFLAIVLFSTDGLLGWWSRLRDRLRKPGVRVRPARRL
jgi:branched-chain amino acid transport system permease protein